MGYSTVSGTVQWMEWSGIQYSKCSAVQCSARCKTVMESSMSVTTMTVDGGGRRDACTTTSVKAVN